MGSVAAASGPGALQVFLGDIKVSHTVFALPMALLAFVVGSHSRHWAGMGISLLLVLACMVSARTLAMAMNRLLDARIDAQNARTSGRAIPAGRLAPSIYGWAIAASALVFTAACAGFRGWLDNPWPLWLSVPVLLFLAAYPLLKRFTALCHLYLGAALGLSAPCAWVASGANPAPFPWLLGAGIMLWTAGFDIIYACQDTQSDRSLGLHSIPARLGIGRALWLSRALHIGAFLFYVLAGRSDAGMGVPFTIALGCTLLLLVAQHVLVWRTGLAHVNIAFFTLNGLASLVLGTLGIVDTLLH